MKQEIFSQDQKTIISRVRNLTYGYIFVANVIDYELYNSRIQVNKREQKAFVFIQKPILYDQNFETHFYNQTLRWVNYLIDISFGLLDTLVRSGLAKTLTPSDLTENIVMFGPGAFNMPYEVFEITNKDRVSALIKYADIQLEINDKINNLI